MKCKSFLLLLCLSGCLEKEKELDKLKEATTIRSTYYLKTIVHDEHLFIIADQGYFMHHPDCPCFKTVVKEEAPTPPPKIIFDIIK